MHCNFPAFDQFRNVEEETAYRLVTQQAGLKHGCEQEFEADVSRFAVEVVVEVEDDLVQPWNMAVCVF